MTRKMLLQVLMALGVGGTIGLEREARVGNGLRTLTWQATGRRHHRQEATEELIGNDLVHEFTVLQFDELS